MPHSECSVVFLTVPDQKTADAIAAVLLDRKLAACVAITPGVQSRYWWQGKRETATELALTAKTLTALLPALIKAVKAVHPYEVPEIVAVPITAGNPDYLKWIADSCTQ